MHVNVAAVVGALCFLCTCGGLGISVSARGVSMIPRGRSETQAINYWNEQATK